MFDRLFQFIRQGVRDAILGGIEDAAGELAARIEAGRKPELLIEADATPPANGRARQRAAK